eukprot:scaffold1453_cov232-Alexandrium_tamarense.AAC.9
MLPSYLTSFILFLVVSPSALSSSTSNGNGNGKASSFSPIRELGPSLAASVAGGTVIAVRSPQRQSRRLVSVGASSASDRRLLTCDTLTDDVSAVNINDTDDDVDEDECIVVLFRSPSTVSAKSGGSTMDRGSDNKLTVASVFGSSALDLGSVEEYVVNQQFTVNKISNTQKNDLQFLSNGLINHPFLSSSNNNNNARILHAPSAMASDGARPLGVQLLVIGTSSLSSSSLEMYTVDPSGGWRSWIGSGTAVGRGAERIRATLLKQQQVGKKREPTIVAADDEGDTPKQRIQVTRGWKSALDRAMSSAIEALETPEDDATTESDDTIPDERSKSYGAIVVYGSATNANGSVQRRTGIGNFRSKCAAINPDVVQECFVRCYQRMLDTMWWGVWRGIDRGKRNQLLANMLGIICKTTTEHLIPAM